MFLSQSNSLTATQLDKALIKRMRAFLTGDSVSSGDNGLVRRCALSAIVVFLLQDMEPFVEAQLRIYKHLEDRFFPSFVVSDAFEKVLHSGALRADAESVTPGENCLRRSIRISGFINYLV